VTIYGAVLGGGFRLKEYSSESYHTRNSQFDAVKETPNGLLHYLALFSLSLKINE